MRFFQRPLSSKFLHPESLGLNHFTSTYPLPAAFSSYKYINLRIVIDKSICETLNEPDNLVEKQVAFFYVVDTIIKETLRTIMNRLQAKIDNNEDGAESDLNRIKGFIKDPKKKFVLKLKSYEEYMFGDYPICTYDTIRTKVREFEQISVLLMMYDKSRVNPNITHFPPLIYIPTKEEFDYNILLEKFVKLFPAESIIFKFKPNPELQEFYFKNPMDRREKLTKYCESGECDFPFSITIRGISNIFALKNHLENPKYHESDIDLPYFIHIPSMESERKKKNFFQKMIEKICGSCMPEKKKKEEKEKEKEEEKQVENEHHNDLKDLLEKYKKNLNLQNDLNYLNIKKDQKKEKKLINFFSMFGAKTVQDRIKELTEIPEDPEEKKSMRFGLENFKLPFLPAFLRVEILIMYGSYEIQRVSTRIFIISNEIKMNEKINFNSLLFSHLPRETRICLNIIAYDKNQKSHIFLGCGQCPIFNENGLMQSKTIEVYIWPLFKNDPRVVSISQYFGKFHENYLVNDQMKFSKKDFCVIYVDFPRFVKPFAHILKTPQSYREFLKVKHPGKDVNSTYEIVSLYATSMEDLDQIVNSLRDKDYYFLEVERKRKENEILKKQQQIQDQERNRAKSFGNKGNENKFDEKESLKKSEANSERQDKSGDYK